MGWTSAGEPADRFQKCNSWSLWSPPCEPQTQYQAQSLPPGRTFAIGEALAFFTYIKFMQSVAGVFGHHRQNRRVHPSAIRTKGRRSPCLMRGGTGKSAADLSSSHSQNSASHEDCVVCSLETILDELRGPEGCRKMIGCL